MRIHTLLLLTLALLFSASASLSAADYVKDIKPLLAKKCVSCHGPLKQEAGLRLDAASLIRQGGESGAALVESDPAQSLIVRRISATEERMPPEGEGEPLTPDQVGLITRWIAAGAPAPEHEEILTSPRDHWSFQPVARPEVPRTGSSPADNPIDLFLAHARGETVKPLEEASPEIVLRRLYLDLIGLPPTRTELLAFRAELAQTDAMTSQVYGRVIERLLESPQHGERWARHWMDVWRYSDWDGYKDELRGSQRHLWRWRDWIVDSLNDDKGYDQMIVEMLAADEVAPEDQEALRATGFLARHHYIFNRDMWLDNCVEHTSKAFLGLTVACAKCHDHKYDPVPQGDYYRLRAVFEPYHVRIDRLPGTSDTTKDGLTRAFDQDLAAPTYIYSRGNEKQPLKDVAITPDVPEVFDTHLEVAPVALPTTAWHPSVQEFYGSEAIADAEAKLTKAKEELEALAADADRSPAEQKLQIAELELKVVRARVAADRAVLTMSIDAPERQALAQAAAKLERELKHCEAAAEVARLDRTINELTSASNEEQEKNKAKIEKARKDQEAATKRVDEAARDLEKTDGSYTTLAPVYPQESSGRRLALATWIVSRDNPLTARVAVNHIWLRHFGSPLVENVFDFGLRSPQPKLHALLDWLAAELVDSGWSMKHIHRLIVSSQAFRLRSNIDVANTAVEANLKHDPDNLLYWRANLRRVEAEVVRDAVLHVSGSLDVSLGGPDIDFEKGEEIPRRSLYFRHAYEKQMTMLLVFDAASPNECYERTESVVPQQALALFNSAMSRREAAAGAVKLGKELDTAGAYTPEMFTSAAFEQLLSRSPSPDELATCTSFLQTASDAERPAREAELLHVLLNHNDFITVR